MFQESFLFQEFRQTIQNIFKKKIVTKKSIKTLKKNQEAIEAQKKWLSHHDKKKLTPYCPLCLTFPNERPIDMKRKHLNSFSCQYIDFTCDIVKNDNIPDENDGYEIEEEDVNGSSIIDVDQALYRLTNGQLKEQNGKCPTLVTGLITDLKVKHGIDEVFLEELGNIAKVAKGKKDYNEEKSKFTENFAKLAPQKACNSEGHERISKIFGSYAEKKMASYKKKTVDLYTRNLFSESGDSFVNWLTKNNHPPLWQHFRNHGYPSTNDDIPDQHIMKGPEDWSGWIKETDENSPSTMEHKALALKQLLLCMKFLAAEGNQAHLKNPSFAVYCTQIESKLAELGQLHRLAKKQRAKIGCERQRLRTQSIEDLIQTQAQIQHEYLEGLKELFERCDSSVPEKADINLAGCLIAVSLIPLNGNRMQAIQNQTNGDFNAKNPNAFDDRLQLWEVTAPGKTPHNVYIQTSNEIVNIINDKYRPLCKRYLSHHKVDIDDYDKYREYPLIIGGVEDGSVLKISSKHVYTTLKKKGYQIQTCQSVRRVVATVAKDLGVPAEHLAHSDQVRNKEYYLNQKKEYEKNSVSIISFFERNGIKIAEEKPQINETVKQKELQIRKQIDDLRRATVIARSCNTRQRKPELRSLVVETIINISSPVATKMCLGLTPTPNKIKFLKHLVLSSDELKNKMILEFRSEAKTEEQFWKRVLTWFSTSSKILDKDKKFFKFSKVLFLKSV